MKLTNYLRDSFIAAVKNDIPEIKWPTLDEVQALAVKKMPPKLKAVYNDENLRKALKSSYYCRHESYDQRGDIYVGALNLSDVLEDLEKKNNARLDAISKVKTAAYACSTLKQLKDMLPELTDYMPSDDAPSKKAVPAVVGVVAALTECGFPKG